MMGPAMEADSVGLAKRAFDLKIAITKAAERIENTVTAREEEKTPIGDDDAGRQARAAIDERYAPDLAALARRKATLETDLATCERDLEEAGKAPGRARRASNA